MTLDELNIGDKAVISAVNGEGSLRRFLLGMGCTPKTEVCLVKAAPLKDPIEIRLRGYSLTLRLEDARNIEVIK